MTAMKGDIVNRVRRLPKPTRPSEALQPLFEAISNAMHAVEDRFNGAESSKGRVFVTIEKLKTPRSIEIIVSDNGIGLNGARFEAFCTTDTNFKVDRGGKGIGRLLWLDAFSSTDVQSIYRDADKTRKRSFRFKLDPNEQITDEQIGDVSDGTETGTIIKFVGLRGNAYSGKFPVQTAALKRHFGSHFLAEFILNRSAQVVLTIEKNSVTYPDAVSALLEENKGEMQVEVPDVGKLTVLSFLCRPAASADFDGSHQIHFTANGRTVVTRKIDGLLGIGKIGDKGLVYHGCVSGEFLDERVNQERTNFTFNEDVLETIIKQCAEKIRETPLGQEIAVYDSMRLGAMNEFLDDYPSFRLEEPEALLNKTPKNASKPEQFAQALIVNRIRRDIERRTEVQKIVNTLAGEADIPPNFAEAVKRAASAVRAEEQRQLTEYVLRRKIVLDVLDGLIRRVRDMPSGTDDHPGLFNACEWR